MTTIAGHVNGHLHMSKAREPLGAGRPTQVSGGQESWQRMQTQQYTLLNKHL